MQVPFHRAASTSSSSWLAVLTRALTLGLALAITPREAPAGPEQPGEFKDGDGSRRGIGVSVPEGGNRDIKTVRVVITERVLCRDREWTVIDGRTITGALLAHRTASTGDPAEANRIIVIKDDRIRLKVGSGAYNLPLEKFSKEDRKFVRNIAEALGGDAAGKRTASDNDPSGEPTNTGEPAPVTPAPGAP